MIEAALAAASSTSKTAGVPLGALIGIISGVLVIATTLGAAVVVLMRSTKNEIIADQTTRINLLKDERAELSEKIARLEGRLEMLEGDFVTRIVSSVSRAIEDSHTTQAARRKRATGE